MWAREWLDYGEFVWVLDSVLERLKSVETRVTREWVKKIVILAWIKHWQEEYISSQTNTNH